MTDNTSDPDTQSAVEKLDGKQPSLRTIAMPGDANPAGDIFGGWIMSQMDLAGAISASYAVRGRLVTVGVESMTFHLPVFVGDQVSCYCATSRVGTTSISIHIETWVRRRQSAIELLKVTEATFTYVAIDQQRRPVPIELVDPVRP